MRYKERIERSKIGEMHRSILRAVTMITSWMCIVLALPPSSLRAEQALQHETVISAADLDEFRPQVAYNSKRREYLVVWHDSSPLQPRAILGKRVGLSGTTIDEFIIQFEDTRDNAQPTVAYDQTNDRYLVAWVRDAYGDGSNWDVAGRIVPWNGPSASFPTFDINTFASKQWNPRVAFAGATHEFLITWWNEATGGVNSYVSAQRVRSNGTLAGSGFVVSSGNEDRFSPDVAYSPSRNQFLVVYNRLTPAGGDIYGVRVGGSGGIQGGGDFAIAAWPDSETMPRVAASFREAEWAVTWQSDVSGGRRDIYARRVWLDGGLERASPPVHLAGANTDERNPDIAARLDHGDFLIVWEQKYGGVLGPVGISARTLDGSDRMGPQIVLRSANTGFVSSAVPEVAASRRGWLAVWQQQRGATPFFFDIHGREVVEAIFADGFDSGDVSAWDGP